MPKPTPKALTVPGSAIVDAAGAATVDLGPAGCDWVITSSSVSTDSTAGTPVVKVYRDAVSPSTYREGTTSGNGDVTNTRFELSDGGRLIFVWSGATVGARASVRLTGAQFPSGTAVASVQW